MSVYRVDTGLMVNVLYRVDTGLMVNVLYRVDTGLMVNVCIQSRYRVNGRWLPTKDDCMELLCLFITLTVPRNCNFFLYFLYQIIPYTIKSFIYNRLLYLKITSFVDNSVQCTYISTSGIILR